MQFHDRSDQAQAQAQAFGAPAFVRAIKALGHRLAFDLRDARAGVPNPDSGLAVTMKQRQLHPSALRAEFHGVVDQIGDGLEKKIAVAAHGCFIGSLNLKGDALVFGNRVVEIAHLAHQRRERDLAEPVEFDGCARSR